MPKVDDECASDLPSKSMFFCFKRRIIAKNVSVKGTPKIIIGIRREISVTFLNSINDKIAIINPMNIAPVSPIKTEAGGKLKTRNANNAPTNKKAVNALPMFPKRSAIPPIVIKAIVETPPAKPSSPSIKLIAFTIAKIQKNRNRNGKVTKFNSSEKW